MARRKIRLEYMRNDSARKATFKKRKKGLIKKIAEITTLCDIPALSIIYSAYDAFPEIWPPNPQLVSTLLDEFCALPESERTRKMVDQEAYLRQRVAKMEEQLAKINKENQEKDMTFNMFEAIKGSLAMYYADIMGLNDLGWTIERNLRELRLRIKFLKEQRGIRSNVLRHGAPDYFTRRRAQLGAEESSSSSVPVASTETKAMILEQLRREIIRIAMWRRQGYRQPRQTTLQNQWFMNIMNPAPAPNQLDFLSPLPYSTSGQASSQGYNNYNAIMPYNSGFHYP